MTSTPPLGRATDVSTIATACQVPRALNSVPGGTFTPRGNRPGTVTSQGMTMRRTIFSVSGSDSRTPVNSMRWPSRKRQHAVLRSSAWSAPSVRPSAANMRSHWLVITAVAPIATAPSIATGPANRPAQTAAQKTSVMVRMRGKVFHHGGTETRRLQNDASHSLDENVHIEIKQQANFTFCHSLICHQLRSVYRRELIHCLQLNYDLPFDNEINLVCVWDDIAFIDQRY